MAIHITNFGKFETYVYEYADMDGYIPQEGDDWKEMNFDLSGEDLSDPEVLEYYEEWWPEFVENATAAVDEALAALEEWQENNP